LELVDELGYLENESMRSFKFMRLKYYLCQTQIGFAFAANFKFGCPQSHSLFMGHAHAVGSVVAQPTIALIVGDGTTSLQARLAALRPVACPFTGQVDDEKHQVVVPSHILHHHSGGPSTTTMADLSSDCTALEGPERKVDEDCFFSPDGTDLFHDLLNALEPEESATGTKPRLEDHFVVLKSKSALTPATRCAM